MTIQDRDPASRRRALVTGASSGIGAAYARRLAKDGYDLVLVARRADRLQALAAQLGDAHGAEVEVLPADLGDPAGVAAVEVRLAAAPPIDLLVNNAGFGSHGAFEAQAPDLLDEMIAVNITSLVRLSRAALPAMLARGSGDIINVSSGTAFFPMPGAGMYMATKLFILGLTRSLAGEVAGRGIRVQALVPGLVETEFFDRAGSGMAQMDPERVMSAADLVDASMAALAMGETVCIPSLPDYAAFRAYEAAEMGILAGVSKDHMADRYRG